MTKNFRKFKRKAYGIRLIKSLVAGISLGMLLLGGIRLLESYELLTLPPVVAYLVPPGAALGLFLLLFFLLKLSDRALARRLDRRNGLAERTQTMLQYENEAGTMYELQRTDTEQALSKLTGHALPFRLLWVYCIALIVGGAVLALSFFLYPEPVVEPPPPEIPFALSEVQAAALEELIVSIRLSEMEEPYRETVAAAVETLLAELRAATTLRERNVFLDKVIVTVTVVTESSSTALNLMNTLWKQGGDPSKRLAEVINYYAWIENAEESKFKKTLADFRTTLIHTDSLTATPDQEKMLSETRSLLIALAASINESLNSAAIPATDGLYEALDRLANANITNADGTAVYGLGTLANFEKLPNAKNDELLTYDKLQRALDERTFKMLENELYYAIRQHYINTSTGEGALVTICDMFEYPLGAFKRPSFGESETVPTPGGAPGIDEGGTGEGGGGGATFGSDDLVLDPDTNTYVEYGTIFEKYYNLMDGKLENGEYTDAEKEALQKYFGILFSGFEEKD